MVKKKECYTKKTKTGKNYTTCVEGQKKPKTIKIKKKKVATKPKKTAQKNMSAGMSMLFTSGLMAKVGAYAIPKKEKERREQVKITKINKQLTSYSSRVINTTDKYKSILEKNDMPTIKKELKKAIKMKKKYEDLKNEYKTIAKTDWKPEGKVAKGMRRKTQSRYYREFSRAKLIKEAELLLKDFIKRATNRSKGIKNIDDSAGAQVLLGGGGAIMNRIGSFTIKNPFRNNQLNTKDFFQQFKEFERTTPADRRFPGESRYEAFINNSGRPRADGSDGGPFRRTAHKFMKLWNHDVRGDINEKIVDLAFKLIGQWANSSTYGKYIKTSYSYDDMKALIQALIPLIDNIENWKKSSSLTFKEREKKNNEIRYKKEAYKYAYGDLSLLYTAEPRAAIKGVNNRTGGTWPFKIPGENHSTHRIQGGFTGKTVSLVNVIKVWPQLVSKYGWNGRWGDVDDTTDDTIVWRDRTHGTIYLINLKSSMASRKKLVNIIKT